MFVFSSQSSNDYENIHGERNTSSCHTKLNFPENTHKTKKGNKSTEKCLKNKIQCTWISQIMRCSDPNKTNCTNSNRNTRNQRKTTLKRLLNSNLLHLWNVFFSVFVCVCVGLCIQSEINDDVNLNVRKNLGIRISFQSIHNDLF